jgi:Fe-S cluster assembly protein SufD
VERTSRERGEPDWLTEQRLAAWKQAEALPIPTRTTEGWRRTDLTGLDLDGLLGKQAAGRATDVQSTLAENLEGVAGSLRIEDGKVVERSLSPELEKKGVVLTSLRQALAERPELVREHLGRLVSGDESKFVALAAAQWEDGLFL